MQQEPIAENMGFGSKEGGRVRTIAGLWETGSKLLSLVLMYHVFGSVFEESRFCANREQQPKRREFHLETQEFGEYCVSQLP